MDAIYKFTADKIVNLKQEFKAFKSELTLGNGNPFPACNEDIMKLLDIDDAGTFEKLEESVDLDLHLSQPEDVRVLPFSPHAVKSTCRNPIVEIPNECLHLNTLREVVSFKKKFFGDPLGANFFMYRYPVETESNKDPTDLVPYDDLLISIRFYRPVPRTTKGTSPRFSEELLVRGNQFLTELRDKVSCECQLPLYEVSDNPEQVAEPPSTNPGFFFITDTFYNDTRNRANPDYSHVIRKWAEKQPKKTFSTSFKTAKMQETRFSDLRVQLGHPQVYQHFGNCEHLFVFSYIQLLSPKDSLVSSNYPILQSVDILRKPLCNVCGEREYKFMVHNSDRHMHDPAYLCRICFNSFHYVDERKLGEFEAYYANPDLVTVAVDDDEDNEEDDEEDSTGESEDVEEVIIQFESHD